MNRHRRGRLQLAVAGTAALLVLPALAAVVHDEGTEGDLSVVFADGALGGTDVGAFGPGENTVTATYSVEPGLEDIGDPLRFRLPEGTTALSVSFRLLADGLSPGTLSQRFAVYDAGLAGTPVATSASTDLRSAGAQAVLSIVIDPTLVGVPLDFSAFETVLDGFGPEASGDLSYELQFDVAGSWGAEPVPLPFAAWLLGAGLLGLGGVALRR